MKQQIFIAWLLLCLLTKETRAQETWQMKPVPIATRWAKQVSPGNALPAYPRPQMVRSKWTNLNGLWKYGITDKAATNVENYAGKILVPFPIESALSGVKKTLQPSQLLWYKRNITKPTIKIGERVLLHFGAVDFEATVFVNGKEIGQHKGGYQNFSFDITDELKTGNNELIVKVWDPSDQGPNPHGKQLLNPGSIYYTPSSGIWQTVWMETVPAAYINEVLLTPNADTKVLTMGLDVEGKTDQLQADVMIMDGTTVKSKATGPANTAFVIKLKDAKLWSPETPFLYDVVVRLKQNGKVVDEVKSYFGMRKIEIKKDEKGIDRIFLNNKYYYNLGVLDQGFWPDGLYTAPTDEALKFDILAAKAMGFNTIRKHIKIEPARWYYHADKIGMLVWQDMVNPGNTTSEGKAQFEKECAENLAQLNHFPCITTWVLFNEKWGQYDQARLTQWIKQTDPTRLVNGHSGELLYVNDQLRSPSKEPWIHADMTDVHAYPNPGHIKFEKGKATVIGEFGGIGVPIEGHLWNDLTVGWGYDGVVTPNKMKQQYTYMVDSLKKLERQGLSASIYTQPFDVESEQNGLMTYDREIIKLPVPTIRNIHAKLWPATKNSLAVTKSFTAKVADTGVVSYATRLEQFEKEKRDSAFLRGLTIMAVRAKDQQNATKVFVEYLKIIKEPVSEANLWLIYDFTASSKDPGYAIFLNNLDKIKTVTNAVHFSYRVQEIIYKEQVKHLLTDNPDWAAVDAIIKKYPQIDGEFIIGNAVIHYLNANVEGHKNAAQNLVAAATLYDDRYHAGDYNGWAWTIFEKSNDKAYLEKALGWSKKALDKEPNRGEIIDTYANLLYKLGRKEEALKWQEKAVATGVPGAKEAYEKMLKGEPTWPVLAAKKEQ
jgi:tetratricopeptide (TPR) repeat protein